MPRQRRMIKRTTKQIRQLRGTRVLFKTDGDNVKYFLPDADRVHAIASRAASRGGHRHLVLIKDFSFMSRVKRVVTSHAKHEEVHERPGSTAAARTPSAPPRPAVEEPGNMRSATASAKKRTFRALWSSASTPRGPPVRHDLQRLYRRCRSRIRSRPRKVLSDLAITEPAAFQAIAEEGQGRALAPPKCRQRARDEPAARRLSDGSNAGRPRPAERC